MDFWRLCDELSVVQAALLIAGEDPSSIAEYVENWSAQDKPTGYEAAKSALKHAVLSGRINAIIRHASFPRGWEEEPVEGERIIIHEDRRQYIFKAEPDWHNTTILVDDLKAWLKERGFDSGFFFPTQQQGLPDYLNPHNSYYAPKLAAAIEVWNAISSNETMHKGKTPKQAMLKWLRENAAHYGLTNDDGRPSEQAIEEIAKIANWNPKGGAPKTP